MRRSRAAAAFVAPRIGWRPPARALVAALLALLASPGVAAEPPSVDGLRAPVPLGLAETPGAEVPPRAAPGAPLADTRILLLLAAAGAGLCVLRAVSRRSVRPLPREAFALLGEAPLGGTLVARVVRFGPKTILVGVSGSTCTTLAEIEDPHVTEALVAACRPAADAPEARQGIATCPRGILPSIWPALVRPGSAS